MRAAVVIKKTFLHDSAPVDLLTHGHDLAYRRETQLFVSGRDANFLKPNVGETKELTTDFRRIILGSLPRYYQRAKKCSVAASVEKTRSHHQGKRLNVAFLFRQTANNEDLQLK